VVDSTDSFSTTAGNINEVFLHNANCTAWKRYRLLGVGNKSTYGLTYGGMVVYGGEQNGTTFSVNDVVRFKDVGILSQFVRIGTNYRVKVIPVFPLKDSLYPNSQALLIEPDCITTTTTTTTTRPTTTTTTTTTTPNLDCLSRWPAFTSCMTVGRIVGSTSGAIRVATATLDPNSNICINKPTRVFSGGIVAAGSNTRSFVVGETVTISQTPNGSYDGIYQLESVFGNGGVLKCFGTATTTTTTPRPTTTTTTTTRRPSSSSSSRFRPNCTNPAGTNCIIRDTNITTAISPGRTDYVFLHNLSCTAWKRAYLEVWGNKSVLGLRYGGLVVLDGEQDGTRFVTGDTIIFKDSLTIPNIPLVYINAPYTVQVLELGFGTKYPNSQFLLIKCASSSSSRTTTTTTTPRPTTTTTTTTTRRPSSSSSSNCFSKWPTNVFTTCITVGTIRGLTTGALRIARAGTGNSNICIDVRNRTFSGGTVATGSNTRSFAVGELVSITNTTNATYNGTYQIQSISGNGGILKCPSTGGNVFL
jgi:hypothetical protein